MKQSLLLTTLLFSFFVGFGQCPSGNITLTSQAEVDTFASMYPNCTEFSGDLTISGNDIIDISSLPQFISVGSLIIEGNAQLTSLVGLDSIEDFLGETIIISNNPLLLSLNGIGGLNDFGFEMEVINNDSLINLEGLNELIYTDLLVVEDNDGLLNLSGLDNYLGSAIATISNNANLESFEGMDNFSDTTGLTIQDNPSLIDISSLTGSSLIQGFFIINNDSLTNLDGLEVTNDFFGFRIVGNDALVNILALSDIPTPDFFIEIIDNPNLSVCSIGTLCDSNTTTDTITINNNAPGCNSVEEIEATCVPCSLVDVTLTSQAEVDAFAVNFPDCDILEGTLKISGSDIVDLSPLSTVAIVGNLEIIDNTSLENLDGLALVSVGTTVPNSEPVFTISGNTSLMNLDGLSQLFEISAKTFEISNNPLVTNFDIFGNVVISLNPVNSTVKIDNNASLVSINGFDEFDFPSGNLMISNNPLLASLTNNFAINILNNVSIINNDSLLNLQGLELLAEGTILRVEGNDSLQDVSGLDSVTGLGNLEIINNPLLVDLGELSGLGRIDNSISISANSNLISLQGLQGLFSFENTGGVLSITDNVNLSDISVLDFFSLFAPYEAIITGNSSLSSCDLNSFCEIIISDGEITIENNGAGCNTVEEVGLNCDACSIPGLTLSSQAEVDSFPTVYGECLDGFVNVIISGSDIVDLTPLSSFTFVAGDLKIFDNELLTNLEGLNNLSSVIILDIQNNPLLSDISAISNALNNDTGIALIIKDNPLLEMCSFAAICNFFDTNIIDPVIENNGEQCASLDLVIENCATSSNLISGTILFDFNNDGCTTDDYDAENILVQTTNGEETRISITDGEGNFSLFVNEGVYTTSIISESLPVEFQGTPESIESVFTGLGSEEMIDFCVEAIEVVNDIAITLVPLQEPRPGFDATYIISYSNLGTIAENGTITINFNEEILFYEDSSLTPSMINDATIQWEYSNMLPFETRSFEVGFELFIPPTVQGGEILVSEIDITTSIEDSNPNNNEFTLIETVVNSYDPNDKQVLQGERILEEEVGDYLDYVVRFQNTGTADAINVIVTDTLSDKLNWNSLRILSSSDDYRVEITNENEVNFIFENINLPPEEQNEEGSNGHIAFQIRSNNDLVLGDAIENTASIFFDFNAPIITNTVVTTVSGPCPEDDLVFTSQAEIDAFPINFSACTTVSFSGNVTISGVDIVDLTPLSQIISVENDLIIDNNPQLTSLEGLGNIEELGLNVIISNNPMLLSLEGLGDFGFIGVQIINNDSLLNLEGLNDLQETFDGLIIEGNDSLQNLIGLDNYSVGGIVFRVSDNISLTSFEGLNSFSFTESLVIEDNPLLTDISSLESLQELIVTIEVVNNDSLISLEGLQNAGSLFTIGGFTISDNDALVDISALSDFETPTQFIEITNNSNLSDCVISLLCDNITNTDLVNIAGNAPGCATTEEVEEACVLGIEDQFLENLISIYPNPIDDVLTIAIQSNVELQSTEIFSITGKKVMIAKDEILDFSKLSSGIYFAQITTNKGVITKKIVKK